MGWIQFLVDGLRLGRQTVGAVTATHVWINAVICLQSIAVEDFEYYAIYESNLLDLGFSFLTFKPIEYLCEVVCDRLFCQRGLRLKHRRA